MILSGLSVNSGKITRLHQATKTVGRLPSKIWEQNASKTLDLKPFGHEVWKGKDGKSWLPDIFWGKRKHNITNITRNAEYLNFFQTSGKNDQDTALIVADRGSFRNKAFSPWLRFRAENQWISVAILLCSVRFRKEPFHQPSLRRLWSVVSHHPKVFSCALW